MSEKQKVLFVDDECDVLEWLGCLFGEDYDVFLANGAKEAFELKKQHDIRVIYTDMKMPKRGGQELCDDIKEYDFMSVVCSMTGDPEHFSPTASRSSGFDDCLVKPMTEAQLVQSVQESVRRADRWSDH